MKLRTACFALILAVTGLGTCDDGSPDIFAGSYSGTWVNVSDPNDRGTSSWGINSGGRVVGIDQDRTNRINYYVVGDIAKNGYLKSLATADNGSGKATLNGRLRFDAGGNLTGTLVWGVAPPRAYLYTLTPQQ